MERVRDRSPEETRARFWSKVEPVGNCLIWRGTRRLGYGRFKIRGRYFTAHRLAYEWLIGPIPEGMTLDHGEHCGNTACVNPSHLDVVTRGENTARSNRRRRGWKCGHAPTPANIYLRPDGTEECRSCRCAARLNYRRRQAAAAEGG